MFDICQDVGCFSGTVLKVVNPLQVSNHAIKEENWIKNNCPQSH